MLKRLFGKKEPKPNVRSDLLSAVEDAIARILMLNLGMLGLELCSCPIDGPASGKKARGYIVGLAEAVLGQFQPNNPTPSEFLSCAASAFMLVHGNEEPKRTSRILLDTIDEFQANDPDVVAGFDMAYADVESIYSDQPWKTAIGLYTILQAE